MTSLLSRWPCIGSILLRAAYGHQRPSAIYLLTLNTLSQSSKEVSRTAPHHLESALTPQCFGSYVLPTGLGGVETTLPKP